MKSFLILLARLSQLVACNLILDVCSQIFNISLSFLMPHSPLLHPISAIQHPVSNIQHLDRHSATHIKYLPGNVCAHV